MVTVWTFLGSDGTGAAAGTPDGTDAVVGPELPVGHGAAAALATGRPAAAGTAGAGADAG